MVPSLRRLAASVVALAVLALAAVGASNAAAAPDVNPMARGPWFVDVQWDPANRDVRALEASGRDNLARELSVIADVPRAKWLYAGDTQTSVARYVQRLRAQSSPGTMATFATHALPHEGCGRYDGGGTRAAAAFRAWSRGVARGIGNHPAAVFLESDGLGTTTCLHRRARAERLSLLADAVRVLSANPSIAVYLDAGAADWLPARTAARLLRRAGIARARGFALNITHYDWTSRQVAYGRRVSRLLGGNKHFVVNTAYNGRGPLVPRNRVRWGNEIWCNPSGRALGPLPTTRTPDPLVDAFFWIGGPGFSDGSCRQYPGAMAGPPVGTFWRAWALQLVRNARTAPDFPVYRGGR